MSKALLEKLRRELEIINSSKKTVKAYLYYVERYLEYAIDKGLNEDSIKSFIQKEIVKKDPSTVSSEISAIKFFFEKVLNQKLVLKHPKRKKTLPIILTPGEIKNMIEKTTNIKHKLIIKLLYGCGLRLSEAIGLKKEDIYFQEGLIHIKLAKGRKERFVKLPDSLREELQNYCKFGGVKFCLCQIVVGN